MIRKDIGCIEDRLVTPYVIWEHLPTRTKYVDFPFAYDPSIIPTDNPHADYHHKRFYSDEIPLTLENFNKMRKESLDV